MPASPGTAGTGGSAPVGTAGTGFTNGGTPGAAGTTATGGTGFGTGGTGTGGATGGTGGATGGTAAGGTAGTGGTGVVVPPLDPYCMGKTLEPLPYTVSEGFEGSGWGPGAADYAQIKVGAGIMPALALDACTQRIAGAVGRCSAWRYTPSATPTFAFVNWITMFDAQYTHPPVCVAAGATAVVFHARGELGGELITVAAAGAQEKEITLTNAWKQYDISLAGVEYNTFNTGVTSGFSWKVVPAAAPAVTPVTTFFIDNIKFVATIPPDGSGGSGGTGGAGGGGAGGGGAGGGGAGGGGTGGTGGAGSGGGGTGGTN